MAQDLSSSATLSLIMQTEQFLNCPYCGETISLLIDHSVPDQSYVEDCEVCCRPIEVACLSDGEDGIVLSVRRGDD
jgi:Cysteine-rich CPXCG